MRRWPIPDRCPLYQPLPYHYRGYRRLSAYCRADPARIRVVNVLATSDEAVCVCNLVVPLGLAQPTVSHHLKKLLDAGLVEREQRGKWAYFSLRRDAVETLAAVADLKGACC